MTVDFTSLATDALTVVGPLSGLEQVALCVHWHRTRTLQTIYWWKRGGDDAPEPPAVEQAVDGTAIPWSTSLVYACRSAGLRWTADVHRDLEPTSWAHATGFQTALALAAGSIEGGDLYLSGQSRESLHLTGRLLGDAELIAGALDAHLQQHPHEARRAVRHVLRAAVAKQRRRERGRVAIVDDGEVLEAIAEAALERAAVIESYRDPAAALERFATLRPDVVLLGAHMTLTAGAPVIEHIRNDDMLFDLNVIGVTASSRPIDLVRAGFDGGVDTNRVSPSSVATFVAGVLNGWMRTGRSPVARRIARAPYSDPAVAAFANRTNDASDLAASLTDDGHVLETRLAVRRAFVRGAGSSPVRRGKKARALSAAAVALEFVVADSYARALRQAGISRADALTAFREIGGPDAIANPVVLIALERLEATCLELFDAAERPSRSRPAARSRHASPSVRWRRIDDVAEALRVRVTASLHLRQIDPGDRLPGIRELVQELAVDHRTVIRACRLLESEGILEMRARSGIYVADSQRGTEASAGNAWLADMILDGFRRGVRPVDLSTMIDSALHRSDIRTVCVADNRDDLEGLTEELRASYGREAAGLLLSELQTSAGGDELRAADVIVSTAFCRGVVANHSRSRDCVVLEMSLAPAIATALPIAMGRGPTFVIGIDPQWSHRVLALGDGDSEADLIPLLMGHDDLAQIPSGAAVFIMPAAVRAFGEAGAPGHYQRIRFAFRPRDAMRYLVRLLERGMTARSAESIPPSGSNDGIRLL